MSQDSVERLLGRLLTDVSFRASAAQSLEKICRQEGYSLTEGELSLVRRIDTSIFKILADRLDSGLCRAATREKITPQAQKLVMRQDHQRQIVF